MGDIVDFGIGFLYSVHCTGPPGNKGFWPERQPYSIVDFMPRSSQGLRIWPPCAVVFLVWVIFIVRDGGYILLSLDIGDVE